MVIIDDCDASRFAYGLWLAATGVRVTRVAKLGVARSALARLLGVADLRRIANPEGSDSSQLAILAARPGASIETFDTAPVTIVATCKDEKRNAPDFANSILSQMNASDEFVVVDGGSVDGTIRILEHISSVDPRLRVLRHPGTNISQGRNIAVEAAKHSVVVCADFGCDYSNDWLLAMRLPFESDPALDLVVGVPSIDAKTALETAQAASCYPRRDPRSLNIAERVHSRIFGPRFDPKTPFARFMAFRGRAWKQVGGFPEDMRWAEDGEFGRRLTRLGRFALTVDGEVRWRQRPGLRSTFAMYCNYGRGTLEGGRISLIFRDMARAAFYPLIVYGWLGGRRCRFVASILYGSYISAGVARCLYDKRLGAAVLVPIALLTKDLGKVYGELSELVSRSHSERNLNRIKSL